MVETLATWWLGGGVLWLIGAGAVLANWPFTLLAIRPVNDTLKATFAERSFDQVRPLMKRWGGLHSVRTGLGLTAMLLFIIAAELPR